MDSWPHPLWDGTLPGVNVTYTFTHLNYRLKQKIMNMIKNPQLHWSEQEASEESNKLLCSTGGILADHSAKKEISEEHEERIRLLR